MYLIGYDIYAGQKKLKALKNLSRQDRLDWMKNKRWEIAKFHYLNNNVYRKKIGEEFPNKWKNLPVMEKVDYQIEINNIISKGFNIREVYKSNTSGSSGHPFHFVKDKDCHALSWAFIINRYESLGIKEGDLEARFYGIPLETIPYFKEKLKDLLMNRVRFPVFDLSDYVLDQFVKRFKKKQFNYIYGYTNSILIFARYLIEHKIKIKNICPTLKLVIVTSEVCTIEDRGVLNKAFDLPIYSEYGASEFGYIGTQDSKNHWKVANELLFLENDSDGNILITDLNNRAFPFIRYNIGDIGKVLIKKNGNQIIDSLIGRTNDNIILPSGKISPGLTFYYVSKSLLEKTFILKEFVIKQTKKDFFEFDIVASGTLDKVTEKELQNKIDTYLEPGINFKVNIVEKIIRPNNGKIKHFYSFL
tara:strand:+ start:342 stop:1592 length:1251 start_codon:yes stop_codon:yes gene_type:complete